MTRLFALSILVAALCGCGGDAASSEPTSSPAAGGNDGNGSGAAGASTSTAEPTVASDPDAPVVGTFTVIVPPPDPATGAVQPAAFQGIVRDGPALDGTGWSLLEENDACRLLEPTIPSCDPACESGSACVPGDLCRAHPAARTLGRITLSGLALEDGATEFSITPLRPNYNYLPAASIRLRNPPTDEGAAVQLTSEGGDYDPVTLVALGIAPLDVAGASQPIPFAPDAALLLQWTPPAPDTASQIWIEIDISHHGGAKGKIECSADDTGELEIPQAMVAGLIDLGFAGYPTIHVVRRSAGYANIAAGQVAFEIISDVELPLEIPGLVSCSELDPCDMGQTCAPDRTCQ